MEVGDGQQRCLLFFEPIQGLRTLTLGAMPIAATVRHEVLPATLRTIKQLAAQGTGAAGRQSAHGFPLVGGKAQRGRNRSLDYGAQHLPQSGAARHGN